MRYFPVLTITAIAINASLALAQSNILESVKNNPQEAVSLCNHFRTLNSKGISASSEEAIKEISRKKNLTIVDAEVLSIYVIGLHCPDVK